MRIKNLATALASACLALTAASCSSGGSDVDVPDMIAVQTESDGNWSFYKPDGTIVYADEFKNRPSAVYGGLFSVKEGEGHTLYHAGDKPEALKDCDNLKGVGACRDGLIPVVFPKSRITVLDTKGNKKFTLDPVKNKEIAYSDNRYYDGMLRVTNSDDLQGYFDKSGKCVIEPQYNDANAFSEGLALVRYALNDSTDEYRYKVINKKNETVFTYNKDYSPESYRYSEGYLVAKDANDRYILLDKKGEVTKLSSKCKGVRGVKDGYVVFTNDDNEAGVMTIEGEIIIRAKYEHVQIIDSKNFLCNKEKEAELLDAKGDVKLTIPDYEGVFYVGKYGYLCKDKNTYAFLNKEGKPVSKDSEFADISDNDASSWRLESDYFSTEAVVKSVVELVSSDGVGKYKLGTTPSAIYADPQEHKYTSSADLSALETKGWRYGVDVYTQYTESMSTADYTSTGYYSYTTTWKWNADAKLKFFRLYVHTSTDDWGIDGAKALTAGFAKAGYKSIALVKKPETEYCAMMTKDKITVAIMGDKGDSYTNVYVFLSSDEELTEEVKGIVRRIDENPADAEEVVAEEVDWGEDTVVAVEEYY